MTVTEPEAGDVIAEHPPIWPSEGDVSARTTAPLMGEHTDEVLRSVLHLSEQELDSLRAESVLD